MNIAMFTNSFLPTIGGAEIFLSHLCSELSKKNKVIVFANNFNGKWVEEKHDGIKVYRFPMLFSSKSVKHNLKSIYFIKKVHDILKQEKISIVHAHFASAPAYLAMLTKEAVGIPYVLTLHGYDLYEYKNINEATAQIFNSVVKNAGRIICPSRKMARELKVKCAVISNGIRKPNVKKAKKQDAVLTARRLVDKNGIDDLIRYMKNSKTKLWIVGDGPEKEKLEKIAGKNTTFFGHISEKKKWNLYSKAKAFILPTKGYEGCSIAMIEAMAFGLPILATRESNAKEFVNCITFSNRNELLDGINKLLEDEKYYSTVSEKTAKSFENFTIEKTAAEYEKIYKSIRTVHK